MIEPGYNHESPTYSQIAIDRCGFHVGDWVIFIHNREFCNSTIHDLSSYICDVDHLVFAHVSWGGEELKIDTSALMTVGEYLLQIGAMKKNSPSAESPEAVP